MAPLDPPTAERLVLAGAFPAPDRAQWLRLVDGVLVKTGRLAEDAGPGAGERLLTKTTYDGVAVRPLYTAQDALDPGLPGSATFVRGATAAGSGIGGWDVRVRHADPDAVAARRAVLADLENGAGSVWLRTGDTGIAIDDLPTVLADVHLDLAATVLEPGADVLPAAEAFLALVAERGSARAEVRGSLGADPLGLRARTGTGPDAESVVSLAHRVRDELPAMRVVTADATAFHDAGASDGQELGCSVAAGTAYLRALVEGGIDVDTACGLLEFRYAATADQFGTIAKLRAARRLWARVAQVCGAQERSRGQQQHAVTSSAILTRRDPWVNMLRGTVAAFAAGVGGAQAVTVAPFDAALGVPDGFARRIARNTQALLVEESHVARVIDPAGGSWYVEQLTDELARAGWAWFQEIERAGGLAAALDSGLVADRIAGTREQRAHAVATRRDPITGVSEFPDLDEQPVPRPQAPAEPGGGLPRVRYAEPFEALRDAADGHRDTTGARPRVVLATLGPPAAHTVRLGFARNLLQAGGIDAPSEDADAAAGAAVVCLCGSDALYAERGAATVAALRSAGATHVLLAGSGGVDGVDGHLYTGCDALAVLTEVHRVLGVVQ